MADDKANVIKNIKNGGSVAIYIGTASIIRPIVKQHNQERNAVTKLCSVISGTVISCGISKIASKWWNDVVDKVADFIDDVMPAKKEDPHA